MQFFSSVEFPITQPLPVITFPLMYAPGRTCVLSPRIAGGIMVASGEILVVATPEPTSITDSYSLLKALNSHSRYSREDSKIKVIANKVTSADEGEVMYSKLNSVVSRYLKLPISYLGAITQDVQLEKAVMQQMPVSMQSPNAKSARAFEKMAYSLMDKEYDKSLSKRGMAAFFSHIVAANKKMG